MIYRYVCDSIQELRKSTERLSIFSIYVHKRLALSLIEEIQTSVNRMEAAIAAPKELKRIENDYNRLKKSIKKLKEEKRELTGKHDDSRGPLVRRLLGEDEDGES